jgi:hypothetical protein
LGRVDAGLACSHTLAGHYHRLHAHQELIVAIDARGRRDDHPPGRAIDGNHRPGRERGGRCEKQRNQGNHGSVHGAHLTANSF